MYKIIYYVLYTLYYTITPPPPPQVLNKILKDYVFFLLIY